MTNVNNRQRMGVSDLKIAFLTIGHYPLSPQSPRSIRDRSRSCPSCRLNDVYSAHRVLQEKDRKLRDDLSPRARTVAERFYAYESIGITTTLNRPYGYGDDSMRWEN
ncbi:hypothetical protein DIRU0_C09516 [Diutina rugosa]